MSTNRIVQTLTGALRPWLIVSLIGLALLVALPPLVTPAQSADYIIYLPLVMKNFPFTPVALRNAAEPQR